MYNNEEKKNWIYQKKRQDSKTNSLYKRIHKEYPPTEGKKTSKKQFICENAKKNLNFSSCLATKFCSLPSKLVEIPVTLNDFCIFS